MRLKWSTTYYHRNGDPRLFYQCGNYPKCRETHGAHPDGRPMGTPAMKETRRARQRLHHLLDQVWPYHVFRERQKAYKWLKENAPKEHVGEMTEAECSATAKLIIGQYIGRLKRKEKERLESSQ